MTRRKSKEQYGVFVLLIILGLIAALASSPGFWIFIILGIGMYAVHKYRQTKRRIEYLRMKYGDEALVQRILLHNFWHGQTSEQLLDSLGDPLEVDKIRLKTRKREVWKYDRRGVNRFGLRITLDDDIVVGWDQKA